MTDLSCLRMFVIKFVLQEEKQSWKTKAVEAYMLLEKKSMYRDTIFFLLPASLYFTIFVQMQKVADRG